MALIWASKAFKFGFYGYPDPDPAFRSNPDTASKTNADTTRFGSTTLSFSVVDFYPITVPLNMESSNFLLLIPQKSQSAESPNYSNT